jgi:hypothetical protein
MRPEVTVVKRVRTVRSRFATGQHEAAAQQVSSTIAGRVRSAAVLAASRMFHVFARRRTRDLVEPFGEPA